MLNLLDQYEIRARLVPTIVIVSPFFFLLVALDVELFGVWQDSVALGATALVLLYIASLLIRSLGVQIEKHLWTKWGGPPSRLVLLSTDRTFSPSIKKRIIQAVLKEFEINLDEINADTEAWSELVDEAFQYVRQHVRHVDPNGLWGQHLAEYGVLRNFYGSLFLMSFFSLICTITLFDVEPWELRIITLWYFFFPLLTALPLVLRYIWLPFSLKVAAFRYAESTWISFLHSVKQ